MKRNYKIHIEEMIEKININLKNVKEILQNFKNSVTPISQHNSFAFGFILKGICPFRKIDLKAFHERLRISNECFDLFITGVLDAFKHFEASEEIMNELKELLESYRGSIVNE